MPNTKPSTRNPWAWIPTLYTAEGLPYVLVMTVSVIMYKGLGISNTDIALYTSWLYLPWVIKPLWSPVVDILKHAPLVDLGDATPDRRGLRRRGADDSVPNFFQYTLAFFWLLAFSSATHDIAADGFYLLATTEKEQAFFVGIRSTFYRIATIFGQGLLVILAGYIQSHTGLPKVELTVTAKPGAALVQSVNPASFAPAAGERRRIARRRRTGRPSNQPATAGEGGDHRADRRREGNGTSPTGSLARASNTPCRPRTRCRPVLVDAPSFRAAGEIPARTFWPRDRKAQDRHRRQRCGRCAYNSPNRPAREIVVTPAFKSGDKSVSLAEGARLVFDDSNWNKPALAVIQLDPKLKTATTATFEIRSGNIPLSWTITFFVLVGLFMLFGFWHEFILPLPRQRPTRRRAQHRARSSRSSSKRSARSSPRNASASCCCSCCFIASARRNW